MKIVGEPLKHRVEPPWFLPLLKSTQERGQANLLFFDHEPSDIEIAARVSGGAAVSSTLAEDNGQIFRITPAPRPPMWFMYAAVTFPVLGGLVAILAFHDGPDKWKWLSIIAILGPVAAILCLDLVSWLWKLEGTEDYIVVDRTAGEATLPRLGVAAPVSDVTRLVETIHGENPNSVGLVIKNDVAALPDEQWVYAYVFSPYGRKDKFVPLLADALGVPLQQSNGSGIH